MDDSPELGKTIKAQFSKKHQDMTNDAWTGDGCTHHCNAPTGTQKNDAVCEYLTLQKCIINPTFCFDVYFAVSVEVKVGQRCVSCAGWPLFAGRLRLPCRALSLMIVFDAGSGYGASSPWTTILNTVGTVLLMAEYTLTRNDRTRGGTIEVWPLQLGFEGRQNSALF